MIRSAYNVAHDERCWECRARTRTFPSRIAERDVVLETLLETLRIPYARFAFDGTALFYSASARALLNSTDSPNLPREIGDIARLFGHQVRAGTDDRGRLEHDVIKPDWTYTLRLTMTIVEIDSVPAHTLCAFVVEPGAWSGPGTFPALSAHRIDEVLTTLDLSAREREVAVLLWSGATSAEIAAQLQVTIHTARRHTEQVFKKLRITSRAAVGHAVLQAALARITSAGRET